MPNFPIAPTYAAPFIRKPDAKSDAEVTINPIWLEWFLNVAQVLGPSITGNLVPETRTINTTPPLAGGGDLSANRTLSVALFTDLLSGIVPASGGGTTNFLRADGTWAAPPAPASTIVYDIAVHRNATANVTLSNQPAALRWLGNNNRNIIRQDLSNVSEVRFYGRIVTGSASVNNPRIFVGYSSSFTTVAASYTAISGLELSLTTAGYADSGWLALPVGAQADVFLGFFQEGGDGVADPAVAQLGIQCR